MSGKDASVINIHDMGREVQLSFYSGPSHYEPSPGSQQCNTSWRQGNWPWNPIGAGDVDGHRGAVLQVEKDDRNKSIYIKTTPLQWACDNVPCKCTFEKWITLNGAAAVVNAQLTNARTDHTHYRGYGQELPAIYTIGSLYQVVAYNGTEPFSGGAPTYFPLRTPVGILATEHWAALVNKEGWGLGVFQPATIQISAGFFGTPGDYGPHDNPTGYLGPHHIEILDWDITYSYSFHLVLGTVDAIRKYAYDNRQLAEDCLEAKFASNRQHWVYQNAADSGLPRGYWHVAMEMNDPQLYGPNCLWKAEEHPRLYINASFGVTQASTEAQLFWNRVGFGQNFDESDSVHFPIKADGRFHVIEVDLSTSPNYKGSMFGLRFDPVVTGTDGAYVNIAYITLK